MAHTLPPWTSKYRMVKVFANVDNNELAARLGSIITFDRRGDLFWFDDMESGNATWNLAGAGTGNSQGVSTDRARNGAQSMLLKAGSDGPLNAQMARVSFLPQLANIGFEMSFSIDTNVSRVDHRIWLYYSGNIYKARVTFDNENSKIYYVNSAGSDIDLESTYTFQTSTSYWLTSKIVVDFSTGKWVRVLIGPTEYDLSAQALQSTTTAVADKLYCYVDCYSKTGVNGSTYVDDAIITQNEP